MFYSSFKLCNQSEYCTPKGPNFKWTSLVRFSANGTNIQLRIPRHRTDLPTEARHARGSYDLEKLHLDYCMKHKPHWRGLPIIYRIWEFYGPWFTGRRSIMYTSLNIISPGENPGKSSFFYPRAFEGALADYLTYYHGADRNVILHEQAWLAPVNWNPVFHLPSIAVSFDVIENCEETFRKGEIFRYLCVPITDRHFLCLSFHFTRARYLPEKDEPRLDIDSWINIAPMKALADDVINSLQITLSPEAQAQQANALSGLEDASLVKEFPPLIWT